MPVSLVFPVHTYKHMSLCISRPQFLIPQMNGHILALLVILAGVSALPQPKPVPEEPATHLSEKKWIGMMVGGLLGAVVPKLFGRHKRSLEPADATPEDYLRQAILNDDQDCGRRFVCELEAASEDELSVKELFIRSSFR